MLSPIDVLKGFINLKSYFTWVMMAMVVWSGFSFFKKRSTSPSWSKHLTTFFIILGVFSLIYFCCFRTKEPSSKYYGQLIGKIDQAIDKYSDTINNYNGLKKDWEKELEKCDKELKDLYEQKDLTQEAKEKIKEALEKNEAKIKEIKENLDQNDRNITILKGKLVQLEKDKETKEKEIKDKERQKELASPDDKIRLQAEINKLRDEILEIVGEIGKIKVQIGKLEATQRKYQEMLIRAEGLKKDLEKRFVTLSNEEKSIFKQIQSVEERRVEIQKEIEEVNEKIKLIGIEKEQLCILRVGAEAAKTALDDWDKKHQFSFGNLRDALFQGAELYMDTFGGRGMLKAVGGGVTKKVAGTVAKVGLAVHETHRIIHLAQELFCHPDGTLKMMSQETYDSICTRIDRDLAKLDADYKDYEKKKADYKLRLNQDNLKNECKNSEKFNVSIKNEFRTWIDEYTTIIEELIHKQEEVSDTDKLFRNKNELEYNLSNKEVELNTAKEELKQKNPSYARAQQRFIEQQKNKKCAQFYQPIIDK
ncbi:MAG: DNA double-strand break repair protein Rad50 [Candidatus Phytoplasma stylosanthis]|uniref:DNA double-strand break repair protein Rad50 n=1 Tax=Candidatus Phytoplasma stylosanthis TaxID=2798314 RepID=UPI00293A791B|nr:DNA double-strand break repair protein Rad50 [Candidatus Phytoplasma stylosanthis]MDV3171009.1 DNA double-strand break repair protein Rad50 [Candidatus Phytoplasma stylosanthis]